MPVAFLIMAHNQPRHLARLVNALRDERSRFFIHIDRKARLDSFISALPRAADITYLEGEARIKCNWGGYSLVQAALNLVRASMSGDDCFDRFCLLSGADYPLVPLPHMFEALASDQQYISVCRVLDPSPGSELFARVRYLHFRDHPLLMRSRLSGRIWNFFQPELPIYGGSAWWSLTRAAVDDCLRLIAGHPGLVRQFRYMDLPEEAFFQTLLMASPWKSQLSAAMQEESAPGSRRSPHHVGAHFIDWSAGGNHPKVLDIADLPKIVATQALFGRKIQEGPSDSLLDALDARMRSVASPPDFSPGPSSAQH